jgi:hypothetical protein
VGIFAAYWQNLNRKYRYRSTYNYEVKAMTKLTKKSVVKIMIWLAAEIMLNLAGLDDLADYSEFVFERSVVTYNYIKLAIG